MNVHSHLPSYYHSRLAKLLRLVMIFVMIVPQSLVGGVQVAQAANGGSALQFNGSNQYVTFGTSAGTTTGLGVQVFTIETWFKRTGAGATTTTGSGGITAAIPLVSKGRGEAEDSNVDMNYFFGIDSTTNKLVADFEECAAAMGAPCTAALKGGQNYPASGNTAIQTNVWYHAAVTYDGQTWRFYLNGAPDGSTTLAAPRYPRWDSVQHAGIGTAMTSAGAAAGFFAGVMDEVRIWNVVRSPAEIAGSMNNELTSGSGLIGRWGLNENTGTAAANSISGRPNGTLTGSPTWVVGFPLPDSTPPAAPTALTASAYNAAVSLSWTAPADFDLAGYNIYRSATPSVPLTSPLNGATLVTSATYTDLGLTNGATYYYVVTAVDTSTNQSAASNEVSATPAASLGAGLQLNGSNQYVTFGTSAGTTTGLGVQVFTIETWFKRTGAGATTTTGNGGIGAAIPLVSKGRGEAEDSNVDMNYFFGIDSSTNKLVADFEECAAAMGAPCTAVGAGGQNYPASGNSVIQNNVWYHAAVTYDGQTWRFYLNGAPDGSTTLAAPRYPRWDSVQHAGIGTAMTSAGAAAGYFAGVMDEVRIWNVVRSPAEIAGSMNNELTSGSGLVGRWGLNEGTGTAAGNSISGRPNGTLTGAPTWVPGAPFNIAPPSAPNAPTLLQATATPYLEVDLTWADNSTDETSFKIERSLDGVTGWTQIAATAADAVAYNDGGLEAGTQYCYRARASNAIGDSPYSNVSCATTPGSPNNALSFGSANAYASFGNPAALNLPQFTLETWFKRTGAGVTVTTGNGGITNALPLITKGTSDVDSANNRDFNYFLGINADTNVLIADFEEGAAGAAPSQNHPVSGSTVIALNTWYHVAVTYDGSTWKIYLNGVPEATLAVGQPPRSDNSSPVALGSSIKNDGTNLTAQGFFNGVLDEVRIWNRARSQAEIAGTLNSQISSPQTGLVARWGLNEQSGASISSSAGTAINGSLTGSGYSWVNGAPSLVKHAPALLSGTPIDGAANVALPPTLSVTVSDADLDDLTVKFYGRPKADDFSLIAIPDTQIYSMNYPALFSGQTNWIVANQALRNIAFVTHLGDTVNNGNDLTQWANAATAMNILDAAGLPFGMVVGNHDQDPYGTAGATANFNANFGEARFAGDAYYGGHYGTKNDNSYQLFSAGGMDFIIIHLEYNDNADQSGVLSWANNLLATYSSRRAIVSTHNLLSGNSFSTQGNLIFQALKGNPNLFLMLGGHLDTAGQRTDTGTNGNTVYSLRSDYQSVNGGQSGYLRILTFKPLLNQIQVETYSPNRNESLTDSANQFSLAYPMAGAAFQQIGADQIVAAGSGSASVTWAGLDTNKEYEWYATIEDAASLITGDTRSFVTAQASNHAPVITEGASAAVTMSEDGAPTPFILALHATDADAGDTLTWSIGSAAAHGAASVSGTGASRPVQYSPEANYFGADSFTVQVSDGIGGVDTITVNVTVEAVNDAPVCSPVSLTTAEDTSGETAPSCSDVDGGALSYSIASQPAHGAATVVAGMLSYAPGADYSGSDNFTYTSSDGSATSSPATVSVTVNAVNDAPLVANPGAQSSAEGSSISLQISASDVDLPAQTLTYSATNLPDGLSIDPASGLISGAILFTAAAHSPFNVTVSVTDGVTPASQGFTWAVAQASSGLCGSDAGLVACWPMEEGSGTILIDATSSGNDATLTGGPTWAAGYAGKALSLSGTAQYGVAPDNASLDIVSNITLAAWVRPAKATAATQYIIKKAIMGTTNGYELSLASSGKVFVRFNQFTSADTLRVNSLASYPLNNSAWMHIAATYDGATIKLYINGALDASAPAVFSIAANSTDLGIGAQPNGVSPFQGLIDDARVYNRALTLDEIQALAGKHTLTVTKSGSGAGTVTSLPSGIDCGATCSFNFNRGASVTLTAVPAAGSTFTGWSGAGCSGTGDCSVTMDALKSVTANFNLLQYSITVTSLHGTITKNPDKTTYNAGEVVQLTAAPAAGWSFTGWSGDASGAAATVSVTMDGDKSVTASYSQDHYLLNVVSPNGMVTITPEQATYTYGEQVQISAAPDSGWSFVNWSGDFSGANNPALVTITGNTSITANYSQNTYILSITSANGTVTRLPDLASHVYGEVVQLTAAPAAGYAFSGWSGDASGSANPVTVTMDGNKAVTANFVLIQYLLTVNKSGSGSGTITSLPAGINCGAECAASFAQNTSVTLSAAPASGSVFNGWSGAGCSGTGACTVTLDAAKSVSADFGLIPTPSGLTCSILQPKPATASTGEKPQSKVWNYAGSWYAVFPTNASGASSAGTWLWKLQGAAWTEVLKLSDRTDSKADVKVSGSLAHILLYADANTQFISVEYSAGAYQAWSLNSSLVNISLPGSEIATIDKDSTGKLWLASRTSAGQVVVYHSDAPYSTWSGPVVLATGVIGNDDLEVVTALPNHTVGVLWSNQNTRFFGFRYHVDGADPAVWSADERPASQSAFNSIGTGMADDHMNVAVASDSTLYAAVKTGYDTAGYPKMALLVRRPNGAWDNLYGIDEAGTRPIILLDEVHGVLTMIYTSSEGYNPIVYRQSPTLSIGFNNRTTLRSGSFNDVSSMKANITSEFVVLYSSSTDIAGQICAPTPTNGADLSISKTNGRSSVRPNDSVVYTLVAANNGPEAVSGASVVDNLPATLVNATWTCSAAGGASCTAANGSGSLNTTVDLPVGGTATIVINARVDLGARGSVSNSATIGPPAGITDPLTGNNAATDTDPIITGGTSCEADPSLVGCWPMEENGGPVLVDGSSYLNDAGLTGSPAWAAGKVGSYALDLSGAGQYGLAPDDPSFNLPGQLTLAAWIKPEQYATQDLIKKAVNGATNGFELSLATTKTDATSQKVFFRINQVTSGDTYRINSTTEYPINGIWMHVAATFNGSTMRLYINGVLESSLDVPAGTTIAANSLPVGIGGQSDGARSLMGWMDEARIYNRALSLAEVQVLAGKRPLSVSVSGLGAGLVSSDPLGIQCGASCSALFDQNGLVTLTAAPAVGSVFTGWGGACSGSGSCTVTMSDAQAVTAEFAQIEYTLAVTSAHGTVVKIPDQLTYHYGDLVELSASPAAGWSFGSWTGDASGAANPVSITIDANKAVTANYTQNEYTLTVVSAHGTVTKTPQQATYHYGDIVTLAATADAGWTFSGFTPALTDNKVTISGDTTITANYTQNEYTLTVVSAHGTVTKTPAQATYHYGDIVTLAATADAGWTFSGFTPALTDNQVTISGDTTVTANYTQNEYNLTVISAHGTVTKTPQQATYHYGDIVTLAATADAGWTFSGFTPALTNNQVTISGNTTITANYTQNEYTLTVVSAHGTVTKTPAQATYHYGDIVTLAATADAGWTFSGFTPALTNGQVTISGDTTVTANYSQNEYTLTVVSAHGTVTKTPAQATYHYGDIVTLAATADAGWTFTGFTPALTDNKVTISGDTTITANYTQNEYTLTVVSAHGTVTKTPAQATYHYGDVVTLAATADTGWTFSGFTPALTDNQVTISGDTTVTANYTQNEYTLTVISAHGTVTKTPQQATYHYGDIVTLAATADAGWTFSGFSPALTNGQVTISGDTTITANYTQNEYTLTVVSAHGTVTKTPAQATYHYGVIVTLAAMADAGWTFSGFTPSLTENKVTISGDTTVTANYTQNEYTLTVVSAHGTVTKTPAQATYHYGDIVTLAATADAGWTFSGFTPALTDNQVTISGDTTVTANYTQNEYTLTVVSAHGVVTKTPQQATYHYGDIVTLAATADAGWTFSGFTPALTNGQVTISGDTTVTANYTKNEYTLTVVSAHGVVTKTPQQATYHYGDIVTLAATADAGWTFSGFTPALTNNQVTISGDTTITANYTQNEYTLTVVSAHGTVTKTPQQATYHYGDIVTLAATADAGWTFSGFTPALTDNKVTISGDTTITANYTQNEYTLTVVSAHGTVTKTPQQATYHYGDIVTLNATADAGWTFTGFTPALASNKVTISGDTTVTANYTQNEYTLTVVSAHGTVTKTPAQLTYHYGDIVTLAATADAGWTFNGFTPALTNGQVTINGDTTVTANYTQNEYTLTVVSAHGTVTKTPAQATYHYGDIVTLAATADAGWTFNGFTPALTNGQVTISGDTTVTANYTQNEYTLTVVSAHGTVTKTPAQATYHYGDIVTLAATADAGWTFTGFTPALTDGQVTISGNTTITANYTQNEYSLTVVSVHGTVTKTPAQATYHYGDVVDLTVTPDAGWTFSGFTPALTNNQVTISGNTTVTANYTQNEYTLTVVSAHGVVTKTPAQATYHYGDIVTLAATADAGWTFSGFTPSLTNGQVTISGDTTITANYTQNEYTLTVVSAHGTVTKTPAQATYHYGDIVTLAATADAGWTFSGFTPALTDNKVTISGNTAITANYTQNEYTLTVVSAHGTVTKTPAQATYHYGDIVTLAATADAGWTFSGFTPALTDNQVTISGDTTVTANYSQNEYTLTVVSAHGTVTKTPTQATYHYGDIVTLAATADAGWTFSGFTPSLTNGQVTISGNTTVTASYTQNEYTLTVVSVHGTVTKTPAQATYHYGDIVTLAATADAGWMFSGFTPALTDNQVTISGDTTVTANYTQNEYTLTVISAHGTVTKTPQQATYHYGDIVTLAATADAGWTFSDFTPALTDNKVTISGDTTITANYTQNEYTLTVVSAHGTVTKTPAQATYHYGDVVDLTVTPDAGWAFANWTGDASGSANPLAVTIHGNTTITAAYTQNPYFLTVTSAHGTIILNPDKASYTYGEVVEITAMPAAGWSFINWSGDAGGTTNPITITMDGHKAITANYTQNEYALTVVSAHGTVTKTPAQPTYHYGDIVTLAATADAGWTFSGFTPALTNGQVTISGDTTITANYTQNEYTLTVVSAHGTVTKTPAQPTYHYGDIVTLAATADAGWTFTGFTPALTNGQVTISGDTTITANYTQNEYTLTVVSAHGTITKTPQQATYHYGDIVTLAATADAGWTFSGFTPALTNNQVTISGDTTITANYTQNEYTLTVVSAHGTVTKTPQQATYHYGDIVTLAATADAGWTFSGFTPALTNGQVTISGNTAITANYTQNEYTLTVVSAHGTVTKTPQQATYHYGDIVTLAATADAGWTFTGFTPSLTNGQVTISGNTTVTASYTQNEYTLTVVSVHGTVTKTPAQATYHYGDIVTLAATADAGWTFSGFTPALTDNKVTISGNTTVTANYTQNEYTLTVVSAHGTVTKTPAQATYHYGDIVTLAATADAGWTFNGFTPALTNDQITISGDTTITANYTQNEYTLTVVSAHGMVTKTPTQATYHYGDVVTLAATADAGWTFSGFTPALTNGQVTISGDTTVTANYTQNEYTLTVISAHGTVTKTPQQATYHYGDIVTLAATADAGWTFSDFTPALTDNKVTISGDTTITANYTQNEYTLTVVSAHGTVTKTPAQATYHYGDIVTLAVTADVGWTFSGFTPALTDNKVTISGNTTITANYTQNEYTLTVVSAHGTVTKTPQQATYHYGDIVTLAATADAGWTFSGFTPALTNGQVTISGNTTVTANYTQNEYTLTVVSAHGTVTKTPQQATYHYGDIVTLAATADAGWTFSGFTPALTNNQVTISGNTTVTANYTQNEYTLTVVSAHGVVTKTPAQATYHYGDVVTLNATADAGWTFSGFTPSLTNGQVTISGDTTITANYTQNEYTLTVVSAHGTVTKTPAQATYHYGDIVTLAATADAGWTFNSFTPALANNQVTISGNTTITANFTQNEYTLTVISAHGTVTKAPQQATYHYGDIVTLAATDDAGWTFSGFTPALTNNQVTISGNTTVTANYTQNEYTLTVVSAHGAVTKTPAQATYHYGDVVELSATPEAGWNFTDWSGDAVGSANPISITVDGDKSVTANYTLIPIENRAPVAVNDAYTIDEDFALNAAAATGVLANDTDADADPITAVKVSGPAHGVLTLRSNGSFTYIPEANFNGEDSFTYKANDGKADSNTGTVIITVLAVNDAPVAVNDLYASEKNKPLEVNAALGVLANDKDVDGNSLTAVIDQGPASGELTLFADGSFTYIPATGFTGIVTFTYFVYDGTVLGNRATVTIVVAAVPVTGGKTLYLPFIRR